MQKVKIKLTVIILIILIVLNCKTEKEVKLNNKTELKPSDSLTAAKILDRENKNIVKGEIDNYKTWSKVTPEPYLIKTPSRDGWFFVDVTGVIVNDQNHKEILTEKEKSDVKDSVYGLVYVNDVAKKSLLTDKTPKFPYGSVIVREKIQSTANLKPEKVIAMIKREKGFNSQANDWEFLTYSNDLRLEKQEKVGECLNCHKLEKINDFVFRSYLDKW